MSAGDRDTLAALWAEHRPDKVYRSHPTSYRCTCGETVEKINGHFIDVLLASDWLTEVKAEAWDEGHLDVCNDCVCRNVNPYRTTENTGS